MNDQDAEEVLVWYTDLEERFVKIINVVPFNDVNKNVVLPRLASIIVEAGSLIDAVFREEYKGGKSKTVLKIRDFAEYYESELELTKLKTLLYRYPPQYITPFSGWLDKNKQSYTPLNWWQNYNNLKHNRIE